MLGCLGTWVSRGHVPPCQPAGKALYSWTVSTWVQRVLAIAPVRLPTYCNMYPFFYGPLQFHRISRDQHWEHY